MEGRTEKLVVFDWNGTLLDDAEACTDAFNVILKRLARPPIDVEEFRRWFEVPIERFYRNAGCSDDELKEVANMQNLFHDTYEPLADRVALRRGAETVLSALKRRNASIVILSNHLTDPIRNQLRRLGIEDMFADVLAFSNREVQFTTIRKGARLAAYIKEKHFDPAGVIIVGDTPEETQIARELGFASVAITGGFATKERLAEAAPDHLIHSLEELAPIMRSRGFAE